MGASATTSVVVMLIGAVLFSCCLVAVGEGAGPLTASAGGRRRSRDASWPAAWKQVVDGNTSDLPSTGETASSGGNWSHYDNETVTHEGEEKEEIERYKVAAFDFEYVRTNLMIAIWVLFASIAKIVFHSQKQMAKFFPESCLLIVIGVVLGVILYFSIHDHGYQLNVQIFFLVLLPPIILDAGYFMPSRSFFDNLGTILLYAVIGTLLNTLWIGFSLWGVDQGNGFHLDQPILLLHCLVFASLLAAVDPVAVLAVFESIHVNEILHIVVFGESLLNDGVAVVLYHMFEGFSEIGIDNIVAVDIVSGIASFFVIVIGATGIGIVCGLLAGVLTRFARHTRVMEPLIIAITGYLSFLLAEMFHLSGILSCTFCGITMRKYCEVNISLKSQTTIKYLLKMLASVCETIIFMYLGISAVSDLHIWNTSFVLLTLLFCFVYRTLGVIILTFFANRVRLVRLNKIDQFIMAYGGLRGAIAFALVELLDDHEFPQKRMFVTTTVVVIYFTNLIMGSTVRPLVNFLKVKKDDKRQLTMNEKLTYRLMDHLMAGIEDLSGQKGHHLLRERFSKFNNKYLKPIIVGRHHPSHKRGYEIFNVYKKLSMMDAKQVIRNPTSATSLSRMNSHIKRLESMPDLSLDQQSSSTANLNLFDVANWTYQVNGLSRSTSQLSELDATPGALQWSNGQGPPHSTISNGGYNIDKANGKPAMTKSPTTDEAVFESLDLSYLPERPQPHIYRRHMLSSVSIPRLESIEETPDGKSSQGNPTGSTTKRVTYAHVYDPATLQKLSQMSGVSGDKTIITFHTIEDDDDLPSDNSSTSQNEEEKIGAEPKQRRRTGRSAILRGDGFEGDGVLYEMQDFNKTTGYKYVRDPEIGESRTDPNSYNVDIRSAEDEPTSAGSGFVNVAFSPDGIDPEVPETPAGRGGAEFRVARRKSHPPDAKYYAKEDNMNRISKETSTKTTGLADGNEYDNETDIDSSQL